MENDSSIPSTPQGKWSAVEGLRDKDFVQDAEKTLEDRIEDRKPIELTEKGEEEAEWETERVPPDEFEPVRFDSSTSSIQYLRCNQEEVELGVQAGPSTTYNIVARSRKPAAGAYVHMR